MSRPDRDGERRIDAAEHERDQVLDGDAADELAEREAGGDQ